MRLSSNNMSHFMQIIQQRFETLFNVGGFIRTSLNAGIPAVPWHPDDGGVMLWLPVTSVYCFTKEAMTAVAGRLILNEILNSDYRDLSERIEKNPDAISTVGVCGESPAHIAIYKNDHVMLKMLLDAGTSPNLVNSGGDSLVHVAARLGYIELIRLLYETKKCILILKNKINQTALDIARSDVQLSNLHVLKLFAEYKFGEPNEKEQLVTVRRGRELCAEYLAEKMVYDREQKVRNMVQGTLDVTNDRRNKARIMRGVGGTKYTSFYTDLTYNTDINKPPWEKVDMEFFVQYNEGLDKIVRAAFACDYANKSIRVGFQNVLTLMKTKAAGSTYPVPTAEALIPVDVSSDPQPASNSAYRPHLTVLDSSRESGTMVDGQLSAAGGAGRARIALPITTRTANMPVVGNAENTASGKVIGDSIIGNTTGKSAMRSNGTVLAPIVTPNNPNRSSTAPGSNQRRVSIQLLNPTNRQTSAPTLQPLNSRRNVMARANTGTLNNGGNG